MEYIKNVVSLNLDPGKCTGCGMCIDVCPHAVFEIINSKAVIKDKDACMECGACAKNCPEGAIAVNPGVGCAAAVLAGFFKGTAPCCGNGGSCCSSKK